MHDDYVNFADVIARRTSFADDARGAEALGLLETVQQFEVIARRLIAPQIFEESFGIVGDPAWSTHTSNITAYRDISFRPRVAAGVGARSTATTILGTPVSAPILLAPVGICGRYADEAEIANGRAAAAAESISVVSFNANMGIDEVAAVAPGRTWYQLYFMKDRGLNRAVVEFAERSGATALMVTIDNPGFYSKERVSRKNMVSRTFRHITDMEVPSTQNMNSFQDQNVTWDDLAKLREITALPIVVKGIQTSEDATIAADHGFDGIVVSNHGGHMLQDARPVAVILPEVVAAVDGRLEVYADGGIQHGDDVLKALALGARAVFIGRSMAWGLTVGGHRGVERVLQILAQQLDMAMGMCGISSPQAVSGATIDVGQQSRVSRSR